MLDTWLRSLDVELNSHPSTDWEELAVEREDDEVLKKQGQSGEAEIVRNCAALDRIGGW